MKERGLQITAGCLIGKVLHTRNVNAEGLRIALNQVWQTKREVKIENIGDYIFISKFGNEAAKKNKTSACVALLFTSCYKYEKLVT